MPFNKFSICITIFYQTLFDKRFKKKIKKKKIVNHIFSNNKSKLKNYGIKCEFYHF